MRKHILGLLLALPLTACSGNEAQVLTGRVMPGFPQSITTVRVIRAGAVVAQGQVAADGSFKLQVPAGAGMSLQLAGSGHDTVVFPRRTGTIDRTFSVRAGGAAFDLGAIRFIGNASSTSFSFHGSSSSSECDDSGHDSMGSVCCDDHDGGGEGTCDPGTGTGSGSGAGSGSGSGSGSGTPVIARNGGGSGSAVDDSGTDDGDAVCEHDFPANGCSEGDDGEDSGDDSGSGSGSGSDGH